MLKVTVPHLSARTLAHHRDGRRAPAGRAT
jgi:hypothetical protein